MIIKKAVYDECLSCGRKDLVKGEVIGCDTCKKPCPYENGPKGKNVFHEYLDLDRSSLKESGHETGHFCSWVCLIKKLKTVKLKDEEYISMPMMNGGDVPEGQRLEDFLKLLK